MCIATSTLKRNLKKKNDPQWPLFSYFIVSPSPTPPKSMRSNHGF